MEINAKFAILLFREEAKPSSGTAKGKSLRNGWNYGKKRRIMQNGIVLLPERSSQKSARNSSIGMYSGSNINVGGARGTDSIHKLQCLSIRLITSY